MVKKALLLISAAFLIGCTSSKRNNSTGNSEGDSGTTQSETLNETTFTFRGSAAREGLTPGSQLQGSDDTHKADTAFKAILGSFVASYTVSSCTFQYVGGEDDNLTSLTIGSAKYAGSLEMNLSKNVSKIKVTIQTYYNPGHSVDNNAEISFNDHYINMNSETTYPAEKIEEVVFESSTNKLKMSNSAGGHRVQVHSITFYHN